MPAHISETSRPSELAITLATLADYNWGEQSEWTSATVVQARLVALGFSCTAQQVGAWMARMARTDAPWVERRRSRWGDWEYRVTNYGRNDIDNRLPGIWHDRDRQRAKVSQAVASL